MNGTRQQGTVHLRVRYGETDQMGVVYHANYLVWCEVGRTELMRQLGFAYSDVERSGVRLAVAEAALRYRQPARYDDEVIVETTISGVQSRTVTFDYEIRRASDGVRLVTATTKLIALDESGAPQRLPTELLERFRDSA